MAELGKPGHHSFSHVDPLRLHEHRLAACGILGGMITWRVDGANWHWEGDMPSDSDPAEVATMAVEKLWKCESPQDLALAGITLKDEELAPMVGSILGISHSEMESEGDHLLVLSSMILANAGQYAAAVELEKSENS